MDIPMITTDRWLTEQTQHYYPDVDVIEIDELSLEYLADNYDVLFMSDLVNRKLFYEKFAPYNKVMRNVHIPHGYSDKSHYLMRAALEDIPLIYGQQMLDMIANSDYADALFQYVVCGNFRYTYYKRHHQFFDDIVANEVLARFPKKQTTILYAPTWLDNEQSTSFFKDAAPILDNLPNSYNMIVKLHPLLRLNPRRLDPILDRYKNKKNIQFLIDFPLIYPLLQYADIYLGDMSSLGYDFLIFDKPMFFLIEKPSPLTQCGILTTPETFYKKIDSSNAYTNARKRLYQYTFGDEKSFAEIKQAIIAEYNKDPDRRVMTPTD
ncbi:MAG: CDP-glycerol glycerophosphotransferase family protein [Chlamydiales bacterium]|nr:CDP-glycerol glycerophosphotransferase family protein [Chlamydiia bacterium]MCP5507513.1 CDP-glycerol glycerophosphotransferase family protein [Chlamydiales bacterium]